MMTDEPILCVVRDLLFYSKIRAGAAARNFALKNLRDPAMLLDAKGRGLIFDLNQDGVLAAATSWREKCSRPAVGFVSHVDTEIIAAARAGGIDRVLARSQFEINLPGIFDLFAA